MDGQKMVLRIKMLDVGLFQWIGLGFLQELDNVLRILDDLFSMDSDDLF